MHGSAGFPMRGNWSEGCSRRGNTGFPEIGPSNKIRTKSAPATVKIPTVRMTALANTAPDRWCRFLRRVRLLHSATKGFKLSSPLVSAREPSTGGASLELHAAHAARCAVRTLRSISSGTGVACPAPVDELSVTTPLPPRGSVLPLSRPAGARRGHGAAKGAADQPDTL